MPVGIDRENVPSPGVRWRGTVAVTPYDRRVMTVTDDALVVEDPLRPGETRIEFDLRDLARNGVLLPYATTLTLVDRSKPEAERVQLRPFEPATFEGIDWPPDVRESIDGQLAASAAARAALRRQLSTVVAGTIAGLGLLLVVLVVVLLLA